MSFSLSFFFLCVHAFLSDGWLNIKRIDTPNKFCYKPENRQILQFCIADFNPIEVSFDILQNQPQNISSIDTRRSQLLGMLQAQIKIIPALLLKPTSCIQFSPNLKLMNIFHIFHLIFSDPGLTRISDFSESLASNLSELFDLLDYGHGELEGINENPQQQNVDQFDSNLTTHPFGLFRSYLIQHIFYNHYLDELRLKVNLTSFLLSRMDKTQFKNLRSRLVGIKVKISRLIHKETLNIIGGICLKYQFKLTDHERIIMDKYKLASKMIGRTLEPTLEQLLEPSEIDHKLLDQDRLVLFSGLQDPLSEENRNGNCVDEDFSNLLKEESCPACLDVVNFDSLRFATCKTGHVWDRCSVTFEILSTLELKTCTNCGRKMKKDKKTRKEKVTNEDERHAPVLKKCKYDVQDNDDDDNDEFSCDSFILSFLDSFVCCPHCGGRWKITS